MAALRGEDGPHGRDQPLGLPRTEALGLGCCAVAAIVVLIILMRACS
jgi:hypothetical protein